MKLENATYMKLENAVHQVLSVVCLEFFFLMKIVMTDLRLIACDMWISWKDFGIILEIIFHIGHVLGD